MSVTNVSFVDAIKVAHEFGLEDNVKSTIIGEGVTYPNGADGTTSGLHEKFPDRLMDVPVSEASFTGMAVGLATSGFNPIVHHGRMEFALFALDQVLTQAAKWEFMFQNDYKCRFGMRVNLGRQWGNGPQHTSSYSSLFLNTPGLNILWPSNPREALLSTWLLHRCDSPTVSVEHRYLFKVTEEIDLDNVELPASIFDFPACSIYGVESPDVVIITYGDGLIEALKVSKLLEDVIPISVVCLTSFVGAREVPNSLVTFLDKAKYFVGIDTSNYEGGLLQCFIGNLSSEINFSKKLEIFSPPFTPCPTSPKLVADYYPRAPKIASMIAKAHGHDINFESYSFDELHLPVEFDFSKYSPILTYHHNVR